MAGSELHALAADLGSAGPRAEKEASQVVRRSGLAVQNQARAIAPVDTGAHRSNIFMTSDGGLSVSITAGQYYAVFLEYGTSKMPPYPALMPALEAVEPSFISAMEQVGRNIW